MVLTGDTCGEHHKGNPSLPHFQSAVPPATKKKHLAPSFFCQLTDTYTHTHTVTSVPPMVPPTPQGAEAIY